MTARTHLSRFAAALALAGLVALAPAAAQAQGVTILRDQETEEILRGYGRPVFEQAGLSPQTVRFVIVQRDDLNAFVAGGQNIFLNTGLILATDGPEELVGVIAHETGHISGGHLFRTQEAMDDLSVQALLANIIGIAVAIGAKSGDAGVAASAAGTGVAMRGILRHSRVQETSADQAGLRFLQGAGLPIEGFLGFMKKLGAQELLPETQQSEYVRTHPLTRDRIDFLQNAVDTQSRTGRLPDGWKESHARMKAKLLGYISPARALQDTGDSIASRYGRAIALHRRSRTDEALALMEQLIKAEPQNPYFQETKAQMLFESGRIDAALAPYARAVAQAPQAALIRAAYAHALLETSQDKAANLDEAVRQLQAALQTEPRVPQTHRLLAIAYGRQGREGLSRLHLAEEALLQGKNDFALREAGLAQAKLQKQSAGWLRAQDILDLAEKNAQRKKKK